MQPTTAPWPLKFPPILRRGPTWPLLLACCLLPLAPSTMAATFSVEVDPLTPLSQHSEREISEAQKTSLMQYFAYWQEGRALEQYCDAYEGHKQSDHLATSSRNRILRTIMTSSQSIGLDLTTQAIADYAQALKWPTKKFHNLTQNLLRQHCSPNLSTISLKALSRQLLGRYQKSSGAPLLPPLLQGSFPLSAAAPSLDSPSNTLRRQLQLSIELFRNFCSWGGEVEYPRLLSFMFRKPAFAAFLIRRLLGVEVQYHSQQKTSHLVPSSQGIHLDCRSLVCRPTSRQDFLTQFSKLLGGLGAKSGLQRMYCHHLRYLRPHTRGNNPTLEHWVRATSREDVLLMHAHLRALVTGVPEFLLQVTDFKQFNQFLRLTYQPTWQRWAQHNADKLSQFLPYEESLRLVKLNFADWFNPKKAAFAIKFLVALGEFDRTLGAKDKIKLHFSLQMPQNVLSYVRRQTLGTKNARQFDDKNPLLVKTLQRQIASQLQAIHKKLLIPPWSQNLGPTIAQEIISQVMAYQGSSLDLPQPHQVSIPIEIAYGPFALRYLHYKWRHKKTLKALLDR